MKIPKKKTHGIVFVNIKTKFCVNVTGFKRVFKKKNSRKNETVKLLGLQVCRKVRCEKCDFCCFDSNMLQN